MKRRLLGLVLMIWGGLVISQPHPDRLIGMIIFNVGLLVFFSNPPSYKNIGNGPYYG